jgi:hypothetical protein
MAERDTFVDISDGDQLNEGYFNGIVPGVKLVGSVYTGSDFDATNAGGAAHTIQLSASNLSSAAYIEIKMLLYVLAESSGAGSSVSLNVQRQETGSGAGFTDILATTLVHFVDCDGSTTSDVRGLKEINLIVTLTAGEKTNGIDIKFTSTGSGISAALNNKQTWFRGISI